MNGGYFAIARELRKRLLEPVPAYMQVLSGPRQVGKTTLLQEIVREYGGRAIYLAADSPEASLPDWWPRHWEAILRQAQTDPSVLLIDEVHGLPNWSHLLKAAYDEIKRRRIPLQIVVSGSSSLLLTGGARESMAGRFERLNLRHWTARDLMDAFDYSAEEAVLTLVRYGAFPGSIRLLDNLQRWKTYIRDAIIDPAIGTDILLLQQVRKPALLRQVFAVCIGHPGAILSLQKIVGSLTDAGNITTIAEYLALLEGAFLVAALPRFSEVEVRRRASPPKLVPLSNAFLTVSAEGDAPTREEDPRRWGHWLENACIARAVHDGHTVSYWREAQQEVDLVVSGEAGKWAVEIKRGEFTYRDLLGLAEFHRRNQEYRPLVIGDITYRDVAAKAGIEFRRWQDYLLDGLH